MPYPSVLNTQAHNSIRDEVVVDTFRSNGKPQTDSTSSSNQTTQGSSKETQTTSLSSVEEDPETDTGLKHPKQPTLVKSWGSQVQNVKKVPHSNSTAINLQNLPNTETSPEEEFVEYIPPEPTVADRLRQARVYLSDEDINSDLKFVKRKEAIEQFMKEMAIEDRKDNEDVYIRVRNMLRVHNSRMEWQKTRCMPRIRYDPHRAKMQRARMQYTQLAKDDKTNKENASAKPLPPFTLDTPKDHTEFLTKFHSDDPECTIGQELRFIEEQAFIEALGKPWLVNEFLQERPSQGMHECHKVRAKKRGRHRAALQLALHAFARNDEQHFEGGWKYRAIRLPDPPRPERPEAEMFKALDPDEMPKHDPHHWTKLYREWHKRNLAEITLSTVAKPLYKGDGLPSVTEARELIEEQIKMEEKENLLPTRLDYDDLWSFANDLPAATRSQNWFSMCDWVLDSPSKASKPKGSITQTISPLQSISDPPPQYVKTAPPGSWIPAPSQPAQEMLSPKRAHYPVQYKPLNPNSTRPSTRLPPEEIGFTTIREDSRDHTPEIGHGEIMPKEIRDWDMKKYGYILEDAPDPKEKIHENMTDLPYGETPFINAYMEKYGSDDKNSTSQPLSLPQTKFALPHITPAQKATLLANAPPRELWHSIGEAWHLNKKLQRLENAGTDVAMSPKRKWYDYEFERGGIGMDSAGQEENVDDEIATSAHTKRQKSKMRSASVEPEPEPEKGFLGGVKSAFMSLTGSGRSSPRKVEEAGRAVDKGLVGMGDVSADRVELRDMVFEEDSESESQSEEHEDEEEGESQSEDDDDDYVRFEEVRF